MLINRAVPADDTVIRDDIGRIDLHFCQTLLGLGDHQVRRSTITMRRDERYVLSAVETGQEVV